MGSSVSLASFGRYQLVRKLGEGGMGVVYEASERDIDRRVALKVLQPLHQSHPAAWERLQREAWTLGRLDHPNVARLLYSDLDHDPPYLVMNLIPGENLKQILQTRTRLDFEEVLDLGIQITAALAHVHQHGIVHRDVKPGNVIVRPDGLAVLSDFGIAYADMLRHMTAGGCVGTYSYMSPEQLRGLDTDYRSDLYSLGVMLFECLTGQRPSTEVSPKRLIRQLLLFRPRSREQAAIVRRFASLLVKCLEEDRERRFSRADDLHDAFCAIRAALKEIDRDLDSDVDEVVSPPTSLPVRAPAVVPPLAFPVRKFSGTVHLAAAFVTLLIAGIASYAVLHGSAVAAMLPAMSEQVRTEVSAFWASLSTAPSGTPAPPEGDPHPVADPGPVQRSDEAAVSDADLLRSAENDDVAAQIDLAGRYLARGDSPADAAEARHWFARAAHLNDATAQVNLGWMYMEGRGGEVDMEEAFRWFSQAAHAGHPTGQYNLGLLYKNGDGVPRDYRKAALWFRTAADQGDVKAMTSLAWLYVDGLGVVRDHEQARTWFQRAADRGNPTALFALSNLEALALRR